MNRICCIIVCALAGVLASPVLAVDDDIAAYNRCVADEAVRLSTGSDAADLIAKNAALLCERRFATVFSSVIGQTFSALEEKAIGEATIAVLEARAKRR